MSFVCVDALTFYMCTCTLYITPIRNCRCGQMHFSFICGLESVHAPNKSLCNDVCSMCVYVFWWMVAEQKRKNYRDDYVIIMKQSEAKFKCKTTE